MDYKDDDLLYTNNIGRKSYQWEVWPMCNNLCKFCYLGQENRNTDKARQMQSLTECMDAISNLDFTQYNNISFIGGEFFQGQLNDPDVHNLFMQIIEKCCQYYVDKKIGSIWVAATLTIGNQAHLYEMLKILDKYKVRPLPQYGASGFWLCTSWDAEGRFHTEASKRNWEYHMKHVHELYPWVKFNTTIILMQKFVNDYISGAWVLKDFEREYHTCLFLSSAVQGHIIRWITTVSKT